MANNEPKDELLLAQWQTCVEMANSISQRRDTMNNIFYNLKSCDYGHSICHVGYKVHTYTCRRCCSL